MTEEERMLRWELIEIAKQFLTNSLMDEPIRLAKARFAVTDEAVRIAKARIAVRKELKERFTKKN